MAKVVNNSKKNIDMTTGSLWRNMLIFSIPLIFSNLLQVLFNMADLAVAGRFAGRIALGAVGSTSILIHVFIYFLIGMGNAVSVFTARYLGSNEKNLVKETIQNGLLICAIFGLIIMTAGLVFSPGILGIMGTKRDLIDGAITYIRIYFLSMPAVALFNYGNGIYSAYGDTKRPLIILLIAGVINVALNVLFVVIAKMDVAGVAWASVISQYLSCALIVTSLLRHSGAIKLSLRDFRLNTTLCKNIMLLGIPGGIQNSIFMIANTFIQGAINSFDSIVVAGTSAAAYADTFVWDVMAAFYVGTSSFIGQNLGARNKERIRTAYIIGMVYSVGIAIVLGGLLLIWGKEFLGLFTSEEAVVDAGMQKLVVMAFSYFISGFMDNTIAASRGLGHTVVPTIVVILGSCVFRIVWIFTIFAYYKTISSLFLLYSFSWGITAVAEIVYFVYIYRRLNLA